MALETIVKGTIGVLFSGIAYWRYQSWRAYNEASELLRNGKSKEEVENIMYYPRNTVPLDELAKSAVTPTRSKFGMFFKWVGKLGYYKACSEYESEQHSDGLEVNKIDYSDKKGRSKCKKI